MPINKDVITFGKGYADLQQDVVKTDGLCDVMIDVYIKSPNEVVKRMAETNNILASQIASGSVHAYLPVKTWHWTSKHKLIGTTTSSENLTYEHLIGAFSYNGSWYFGILKEIAFSSPNKFEFTEIKDSDSIALMTSSLASATALTAYLSSDRVIFCNGINTNWYVRINKYGKIEAGIMGAEIPTGLINVTEITDADIVHDGDVDVVNGSSSGVTVEAGSLLAFSYAIEMKDGTMSNPSPISVISNLQFQNYDITGLIAVGFSKYAKTIKISGITIPSSINEENIKYINIYMQDFPYTESAGVGGAFKLIKKAYYVKDMATATISEPYSLSEISYDNNVAAISKDIINVNGHTFQANNLVKTVFPDSKVEYFTKIDIDNVNTQTFVNQCFRIRIGLPALVKEEGGTFVANSWELFIKEYIEETEDVTKYQAFAQHIRFYDQDMVTPLPFGLVYYGATGDVVRDYLLEYDDTHTGQESLIFYVNIPIVYESIIHSIYFCYSGKGAGKKFFTGASYLTDPYRNRNGGVLWLNVVESAIYNYTVPKYGIRGKDNIVAFGFDKLYDSPDDAYYYLLNDRIVTDAHWSYAVGVAGGGDVIDSGTGYQSMYWSAFYNQGAFQNGLLKKLLGGETNIKLCSSKFADGHEDDESGEYHGEAGGFNNYRNNQDTLYGYFKIANPVVASPFAGRYYVIASVYCERSSCGVFICIEGSEPAVIKMILIDDIQRFDPTKEFLKITINTDVAKSSTYMFWAISYDNINNKMTCFMSELHQDPLGAEGAPTKFTYFAKTLTGCQIASDLLYANFTPLDEFKFYPNRISQNSVLILGPTGAAPATANGEYTQIHNIPYYLNTQQDFINIMFHLPYYETEFIGSEPAYTSGDDASGNPTLADLHAQDNVNVTFNYTKAVSEDEKQSDSVGWSKPYQDGFPALNFKKFSEDVIRIVQSPSFLPFQYQNTILVFTAKTVYRLVLSSDYNDWASSDNVIPELRGYGLMARNSIAVSGQYIYWLSESGLIRWGADGINNISKDKINIKNLSAINGDNLNDAYFGVYYPEKKQYWLFRTGSVVNSSETASTDSLLLSGHSTPNAIVSPTFTPYSYAFIYHEDYDAFTRYEFPVINYVFEYIKANKQSVAGIKASNGDILGLADGTSLTTNYGVVQHTTKKHSANFMSFEISDYSKNFGTESPDYVDPNITIEGSKASTTKTYANITERLKFNIPYGFNGETFKMTLKNISILKYIILTYNQKSSSLN